MQITNQTPLSVYTGPTLLHGDQKHSPSSPSIYPLTQDSTSKDLFLEINCTHRQKREHKKGHHIL